MKTTRKRYSADFMAKVALEAIPGASAGTMFEARCLSTVGNGRVSRLITVGIKPRLRPRLQRPNAWLSNSRSW
jgi:hypothetical protein